MSKDFAYLNGKRIAILLDRPGGRTILRGDARYVEQADDGNSLRIRIDSEQGGSVGAPEIVLDEASWDGEIAEDTQHGCDYIVSITISS